LALAPDSLELLAATALDWLVEPWRAGFMRRALVEAVLCGATLGALGCFVLVRRLAFLGESIAHTVVLGAALALALGVPLGLGGVAVGVATAGLTGAVSADHRFSADTATGILLPTLFAAGVALLALTGAGGRLDDVLFGSILGVSDADLLLAAIVGAASVLVMRFSGKELVMVAFDRAAARALGLRVALLDGVLLVLVAGAVVVGLRAVGSILLAGLLLGPPVAARLMCRTFWPMLGLAAAVGAGCGVVGLYLTWHLDVAAGPAIVLVTAAAAGVAAVGARARERGLAGGVARAPAR
jgi:ABC-type Mn2+/Zn2+ transport system permease subunit